MNQCASQSPIRYAPPETGVRRSVPSDPSAKSPRAIRANAKVSSPPTANQDGARGGGACPRAGERAETRPAPTTFRAAPVMQARTSRTSSVPRGSQGPGQPRMKPANAARPRLAGKSARASANRSAASSARPSRSAAVARTPSAIAPTVARSTTALSMRHYAQGMVISFRYVRYSGGYVERFLSSSSGRLDFGVLSRQVVNGPFRRNGADVEKLVSSPSARQDVDAFRWQVVKLRTL